MEERIIAGRDHFYCPYCGSSTRFIFDEGCRFLRHCYNCRRNVYEPIAKIPSVDFVEKNGFEVK